MKILLLALTLIAHFIPCVAAQGLTAQEHRAMIFATQRWPELTEPNSPHYKAFDELLTKSVKSKSVVFKDPEWPMRIAEKSRADLPALKRGREKFGRLPIEKYEDAIREMLNSKNEGTREMGQLEASAYQAELAGDHQRASQIRAQIAQKKLLGQIQARLDQLETAIWLIKRNLQ